MGNKNWNHPLPPVALVFLGLQIQPSKNNFARQQWRRRITICSWRWIDVSESHVHTAVRQGFWNIFGHFLGDTLQGATETTKYSRSTFGGFLRWGSIHEIIGLSVHYKLSILIHFGNLWKPPFLVDQWGKENSTNHFQLKSRLQACYWANVWVHQWFQKPHEWSCGSCCWAQCPHHLGSTVGRPVGQGVITDALTDLFGWMMVSTGL